MGQLAPRPCDHPSGTASPPPSLASRGPCRHDVPSSSSTSAPRASEHEGKRSITDGDASSLGVPLLGVVGVLGHEDEDMLAELNRMFSCRTCSFSSPNSPELSKLPELVHNGVCAAGAERGALGTTSKTDAAPRRRAPASPAASSPEARSG